VPTKIVCQTVMMTSESVRDLSGSYTVSTGYGYLMRIDAKDAGALGFAVAPQAESAKGFSARMTV
jgi:hypothetical protein